MARKIPAVSNNYEKQQTYKILIEKYNKALKYKFYYEAILIDYAMMEDRLRSCIYYLGLLREQNSIKISNNKAKRTIKPWMEIFFPNKKAEFRISSISGKRKILLSVLYWVRSVDSLNSNNQYEKVLYETLKRKTVDADLAIEYIKKCENWCEYRNEIIHCLFNKKSNVLADKLKDISTEGMEIARYFDKISSWLKYRNKIRECLKLKNE